MGDIGTGLIVLVLFGAVMLAACWLVLPFLILGTKPLLRDLLRQQQRTNTLLEDLLSQAKRHRPPQ